MGNPFPGEPIGSAGLGLAVAATTSVAVFALSRLWKYYSQSGLPGERVITGLQSEKWK